MVAAAAATGGLDGKKVAIEGFGAGGPALAAAAAAQGATIVALSTTKGSMADAGGLDPAELRGAWGESGETTRCRIECDSEAVCAEEEFFP